MYSTLKWKDAIDGVATFLDGGKLPSILVESKVDLLDNEDVDNTKEFEEFAKNNGFDGCFRTSAKTGENVNEAMNYLLNNIIERMENMESKRRNESESEKEKKIQEQSPEGIDRTKEEESIDDTKKCSNIEHKNKEAINYCYECQLYLCDECTDYHNGLLENHKIGTLDEINDETFTGLCQEKNHNIKLEYYCKTHNKLCCGLCICKIKGNGKGQHNECDICLIKDIKEEKINILKDNIKLLKQLSDEIEQSIKKKEEEIKKVYTPDDIAFELDVQGTIIKKLRKNKKKVHPRGIILHGPIARWFRLNQDGFDVEKGHFDIRKIEFDDDKKKQQNGEENIDENNFINNFNNNNKDDNIEEDITVKDVFEKGKLNKKDTIFTSRKIEEFGEKTFKYFFRQVKEYLTELLININGASYNVLKFLSDTNYTNLEITSDKHSTLIKYIYWHPKLQELCIPAGFLGELKEVIDSKDWECKLITLSIKKSNNDNNAENDLTSIFNNNNSLTIQNIHFIDIVYKKGFLDALFTHIEKFYNVNINKDDKYCITPENLETLRETKLPILNLSWKKTQNSDMNPKTDGVNIQGIYYLLMHMLIYSLKRNNGTIPQIFNKLDLSESTLEGSVNYLIKIITKFKIIKELDLSNTKLSNDIKVIDSNIFWSKIKLTDNIEKTFNQKEFYDSTLDDILEEIDNFRNNKQKEEEENNNNMNQKSDDDTSYDYSMGILPLLEKIYLYNTETKSSVSDEIYSLFRKLKFFRGIYYSDPNSRNNQENINNVNFCDALVEKINRDKKTFCEDVFMISNDPKN